MNPMIDKLTNLVITYKTYKKFISVAKTILYGLGIGLSIYLTNDNSSFFVYFIHIIFSWAYVFYFVYINISWLFAIIFGFMWLMTQLTLIFSENFLKEQIVIINGHIQALYSVADVKKEITNIFKETIQ